MDKIALITGITGQDGAYLAKQLLEDGYQVIGTYRRTSSLHFWRLMDLGVESHENLTLVEYDLTDPSAAARLLEEYEPDEVYNFAALSFVPSSFSHPRLVSEINALGPLNLLEAIRNVNKKIRFYQASSSEMFGAVRASPQNEDTPFYPRSPYGISKLFAHWVTVNYRESYGLFASSGILFNHESPLRGSEFVTRKITEAVARIALGKQETLELGNLAAARDWGFAPEYMQGIHRMMRHSEPGNFVLATGRNVLVRDFVAAAFKAAGMQVEWKGSGTDEKGFDTKGGKLRVSVNPKFFRPAEVETLCGDASRARSVLGWKAKTTVEELAHCMVEADLHRHSQAKSK